MDMEVSSPTDSLSRMLFGSFWECCWYILLKASFSDVGTLMISNEKHAHTLSQAFGSFSIQLSVYIEEKSM